MLTIKKKKGKERKSRPEILYRANASAVQNTLPHLSLAGSVAQQLYSQLFRRPGLYKVLRLGPPPALARPPTQSTDGSVGSLVLKSKSTGAGPSPNRQIGNRLCPCSPSSLRNGLMLPFLAIPLQQLQQMPLRILISWNRTRFFQPSRVNQTSFPTSPRFFLPFLPLALRG